MTRQRAEMFRWLSGPGEVFRNPLPNSTNYLNAYNKAGRLIRVQDAKKPDRVHEEATKKDSTADVDEDSKLNDGDLDTETQQSASRDVGKATKNDRKPGLGVKAATDDMSLPKEEAEDLMPFPMNRQFRSQPVLSEGLKDEIYKRVMVEGQDIRTVSATLNIEMRRVGAVVRLKALEVEWVKQVCNGIPSCITFGLKSYAMMRHNID